MTDHKFNNEYGSILFALSLPLDHSEKDDLLFAAHCIWWLASIIQFTEISTYYRLYKIFPLDYMNNLLVMPLSNPLEEEMLVQVLDISKLDIAAQIRQEHLDQQSTISEDLVELESNYESDTAVVPLNYIADHLRCM